MAKVLERHVKDWDEFTGRLQAVETVEIRPRVSGYIDRVAFTEGGQVKRGDLLFIIDPRPYQAETDRAAADLKRYKTSLDLARIELSRVQHLRDSGVDHISMPRNVTGARGPATSVYFRDPDGNLWEFVVYPLPS